jgi:hypothetical protein
MQNTFVFTEAFNCGKILSVCLESFHKHHDTKIHIIGTSRDFLEAGEIINHPNNILINWDTNISAKEKWSSGHQGTALAFASVLKGDLHTNQYVIHIDSDCFFKDESISDIIGMLQNGYDIIGSPRPYKNNLSGVKGLDNTPDCVSTYLMGVNTLKIPSYDFETFTRMCGGWASPTGHRVLDFFDPVTHSIISNGGKIGFLDTTNYGGIDLKGSKFNGFESNLNFDCGKKIAHFGGVGSGKAVADNLSAPPKGYADWAYYRWNFFSHLFFNTERLNTPQSTYSEQNDHNGKRWCNGAASLDIINNAKKDLNLI